MSLSIIILAAGQGTRMYSAIPKVLHPLAGRPLLEHVYSSASRLPHRGIHVVYGYGGQQVPQALSHLDINWVEQAEQLGTGHAVQQAITGIPDKDMALILYGDVPLITHETLEQLVSVAGESGFGLLTTYIDDPSGYGRIVRDDRGEITQIVEEQDATQEQRSIREINTGMMAASAKQLKSWLNKLSSDNAQKEYYLTDIIAAAVAEGVPINVTTPESVVEVQGVNTRAQLAEMERDYQKRQAHRVMMQGVSLMDAARFDLRGALEAGRDVVIDINVVIEGCVSIGDAVSIGPNCLIKDAVIAQGVQILANSVIEDAVIGKHCKIGPFARIRPDTRLADNVHVGNFVELKKAEVASGSKINHLSYVGDSEIGRDTNIGAGTITCNYDGANKHKTVIGDKVFVGSATQLVAPVKIGAGATIAAGTTVTKDVKANHLAISRSPQKSVPNWKRPVKK